MAVISSCTLPCCRGRSLDDVTEITGLLNGAERGEHALG